VKIRALIPDDCKLAVARLVADDDHGVIGWAEAAPMCSREVYRGVVEHSVYVAACHHQ
jgi:L-amino acid N-acyltransferase YncA